MSPHAKKTDLLRKFQHRSFAMGSSMIPQLKFGELLATQQTGVIVRSFWNNLQANRLKPWLSRVTLQALLRKGDEPALHEALKVRNAVNQMTGAAFGEAEHTQLIQMAVKLGGPERARSLLREFREDKVLLRRRAFMPVVHAAYRRGEVDGALHDFEDGISADVKFHTKDFARLVVESVRANRPRTLVKALGLAQIAEREASSPVLGVPESMSIVSAADGLEQIMVQEVRDMHHRAGRCPACGSDLLHATADRDLLKGLMEVLRVHSFKDRHDVFLDQLDVWLSQTGAFDLVIDAANCSYQRSGSSRGMLDIDRLRAVGTSHAKRGRKFCFVANKRHEGRLNYFVGRGAPLIFGPPDLNDDAVVLYVAIWSQLHGGDMGKGKIVTDDQYRDFTTLAERFVGGRDVMMEWIGQTVQKSGSADGGHASYKEVIHSDEAKVHWHVPVDERYPGRRPWLCIEVNQGAGSDGRSQPSHPL